MEKLRSQGYNVHGEYPIGGGKTIDLVAEIWGRTLPFYTFLYMRNDVLGFLRFFITSREAK